MSTEAQPVEGKATSEGTARYASRFTSFPPGAFRKRLGLMASSIGAGTYLGEPEEDSISYRESIELALSSGINVVDTAINYRHQASERDIGVALRSAIKKQTVSRDEIIISSKGGFLPLDYAQGLDNPRKYLSDNFLTKGLLAPDEIVGGCQCLSPKYIDDQFERSLHNIGVEALDIYFVHNPEMQLDEIARGDALNRIKDVFEVLAAKVAEGKLTAYGAATWEGLRKESTSPYRLTLNELRNAAIEVEGPEHHFSAIQLPINLAMSEALSIEHDPDNDPGKTVLEIAEEWNLFVMASASIMQGQLAQGLPKQLAKIFPGCETDAERALQHTRCAPGVTTALVGMKSTEHVKENAGLLMKPCMSTEFIKKMYGRI